MIRIVIMLGFLLGCRSTEAGEFYVLGPVDRPLRKVVYEHDKIAGVSLRASWFQIEAKEGEFDWSFLDGEISKVKAAGKKYMLRLLAGKFSPEWAVGRHFQDVPIPWNVQYLRNLEKFIQKAGERYRNDPDLVLVHINGPTRGGEFHLPAGMESIHVHAFDKIYTSWKDVIDCYAKSFWHPNPKSFCLNVSRVIPGKEFSDLPEFIVGYGKEQLGTRLVLQNNSLHAATSRQWSIYQAVKSNKRHGWQFVSPVGNQERFKGSFKRAIRKAGKHWEHIEIYQGDLEYLDSN